MCVQLFGSCRQPTRAAAEGRNYQYKAGRFDSVKILSTSETCFSGTSPNVDLKVQRYLGMVDTTIYRKIFFDQSEDKHAHIARNIENAIVQINEIMRAKVAAMHGNCILGYRMRFIKLKQEWHSYSTQSIFFSVSATGDAVELVTVQSQSYRNQQLMAALKSQNFEEQQDDDE